MDSESYNNSLSQDTNFNIAFSSKINDKTFEKYIKKTTRWSGIRITFDGFRSKKKAKFKDKTIVRDWEWYNNEYPDFSDEQIVMEMLEDVMSGIDNPDLNDYENLKDSD